MSAAQSADTLVLEPPAPIPNAGIEEALLRVHRNSSAQFLSARQAGECRICRSIHREAQALRNGQRFAIHREHLQVQLPAAFFPNFFGIRSLGVREAHRSYPDNAASDLVRRLHTETPCRRGWSRGRFRDLSERRNGWRPRLNLGAEAAEQGTEQGRRREGKPLGAECGHHGKGQRQQDTQQQHSGTQPHPLRSHDAGCIANGSQQRGERKAGLQGMYHCRGTEVLGNDRNLRAGNGGHRNGRLRRAGEL